jgi:hypothetical protein
MKANNKTSTNRAIVRFDNELKNILMEDLRSFNAKCEFLKLINQQVPAHQTRRAA